MGKISMIVVVGLAVIVGIIGTAMNKRANQTRESSVAVFEKSQARNVAESATDIYTRELVKDPNLKGTFTLNLMGGQATVNVNETVSGKRENLSFVTNATYGQADQTLSLDADALPTVPEVPAALMLATGSTAKISQNGGAEIDGNNHDASGNRSSSHPGVAGVSLSNTGLLPNVTLTSYCVGNSGIVPNVISIPDTPPLERYIKQWMKYPDIVVTASANNADLGTTSNPKVTYIKANGGSDINIDGAGAGILIIDTKNRIVSTKQFTFKGLVIVIGSGTATFDINSNSRIAGAVYVSGSSLTVSLQGNAWVRYSRAALEAYSKIAAARTPLIYSFKNLR